jgi:hypothetical protein
MEFTHPGETLNAAPRHKPKIANIWRQRFQEECSHETIEKPGAELLENSFSRASDPLSTDNIVTVTVLLDHPMDYFQGVLQICIYQHNRFAGSVIDSGR